MINAGTTTELLLNFFRVTGVLHYGIAGNANDELNIGDITIPKYWTHTGLWNYFVIGVSLIRLFSPVRPNICAMRRFGDGPDDPVSLEVNGDYTRKVGYLHFGDYNIPANNETNALNNIWYQPEEVFPVTGTPEVRQHYFWVPVSDKYYRTAKTILGVNLLSCLNATFCLSSKPKVVMVERGASANIYMDNAAYRDFLRKKFNISPIDMESAGVALVCLRNNVAFLVVRSLSDLAGGSSRANEAAIFAGLVASNTVIVVRELIKHLQQ